MYSVLSGAPASNHDEGPLGYFELGACEVRLFKMVEIVR